MTINVKKLKKIASFVNKIAKIRNVEFLKNIPLDLENTH